MSLRFENYLLVEVIHLLIRFNETSFFLSKTKNSDKNDIHEQNTHTTRIEKVS